MDVLNHLAQAAEVILLIELLVVILIFAGIFGGLAFGLRWVRGKTPMVVEKTTTYSDLGKKYLHTGTDYAGKPFILPNVLATKLGMTVQSLKDQVQRNRREATAATAMTPAVASRPLAEEPETAVPLV